uniref:Dit-like phage tail protein N-terminal domain-containing protein n=1 Tax=viral metagenome TaxID=1070528 RepID=A0A6M3M430_9ZZZZ
MTINAIGYRDFTDLQYTPWRIITAAYAPPPSISGQPFQNTISPRTIIQDENGEYWVFDAVIKLEHNESQRITQHPVQLGANITDHSYALPAKLTMEIGMSDVMEGYLPGQWGDDISSPPRSVAAYLQLVSWKDLGMPLTITTRLKDYHNMVVAFITAPDDKTTAHGLKCMVTFQQIFVAAVSSTPGDSAIGQVTGQTQSGPVYSAAWSGPT